MDEDNRVIEQAKSLSKGPIVVGGAVATSAIFDVVGLSCSPRKGGNTDIMVQQVLATARDAGARVEFLRVAEMKIAPCDACWTCAETGRCHIEDDMSAIHPKLRGRRDSRGEPRAYGIQCERTGPGFLTGLSHFGIRSC